MDLAGVVNVLWRRLPLVVAGGVLALVGSVLLAYHVSPSAPHLVARETVRGVASNRVLVDTPTSQVVEAAPKGSDTLLQRADLLADAVATDAGIAMIVRRLGIPRAELSVYNPATLAPETAIPLPVRASEAAASAGVPYALTVARDPLLPIISLFAWAPDRRRAAELVDAGVAAMRAIAAPAPGTPAVLVADPVGRTQAATVVKTRKRKAAAAGAVLFGMWCIAIVVASGARRAWRRTARVQVAARPASR
jgi:hypothetical protein